MADQVFWQSKSLAEMSHSQWEQLCDGCGKCCLHKLEDEDTGEVFYTDVACQLFDAEQCQCSDYPHRQERVPECMVLTLDDLKTVQWLPTTCAYRLLAGGQPLPDWHPLVSGDPDSTLKAGMSVAGHVQTAQQVADEDLEEHIIHWVI
ncbi:YcgN family cysteine cluster protein [Gilvimarinus agarilyticus]|uniref:YcgN family cysteine cluster protein n=1 Tax=unclassified Gilvimarinus TaxID=2642066 RepID=UPI001C08CDA5|nr:MULTISPECIES: YcgN family cysteine cluster protein [unclassified Gilvimarinus]MBU2885943.1 YcgN family cysteine cluster protein [Gilvimarinus agarilyticus]MDO6570689.1 YcgN family cysteine cluster protein [Gilvimarinus sp. 2_MG-2023]MDO6747718.1 YcgN family cysteine cluster protein [Gilvimarinus sp. 1_MG-2023]